MLEFILKDDYDCDDFNYDYLIKIYNVTDKKGVLDVIRDYIKFIKDNREQLDGCISDYLRAFLKENYVSFEMVLLQDMEKIYY